MRRTFALSFAVLTAVATGVALLCGGPGVARAARGHHHHHRRVARAHLTACHLDANRADRYLEVRAGMRAYRGVDHMGVRFTLYARPIDRRGRYSRVKAPDLDRWNLSRTGVRIFRFDKRIVSLPAQTDYRVRVGFRWYDASGTVLAQRRLRARTCRVPDPRPDLRVRSVVATPTADPGLARYAITVGNRGRSAAGASAVVLEVGGVPVAGTRRRVPRLAPGARVAVTLVGPRCAAGPTPTAVVDPDNRVEESDEGNNVAGVPCGPSPTTVPVAGVGRLSAR
jgi:hypothetical protein